MLSLIILFTLFAAPFTLPPSLQPTPRTWATWGPAAVGTLTLSALLAADDLELARAQSDLARRVHADAGEPGLIAGHWGWQHHLSASGWVPLEEDMALPPGALLAVSAVSWPQGAAPGCRELIGTYTAPDRWPGPRVHTAEGAANLHAFVISAEPPVETYAPWGFGKDPHDVVLLWRSCP